MGGGRIFSTAGAKGGVDQSFFRGVEGRRGHAEESGGGLDRCIFSAELKEITGEEGGSSVGAEAETEFFFRVEGRDQSVPLTLTLIGGVPHTAAGDGDELKEG